MHCPDHHPSPRAGLRRGSTFLTGLLALLLAVFISGCDEDNSAQFYEVGEANVILLAAFAAKDHECGTSTGLSVPVALRVDRDDLDACAAEVLATSCATWSAGSPTPALCLAMLVQL